MKLKQEARVLRNKALASLTVATSAFNSPVNEGRVTQVLLALQHAFEMLLKAALVQNKVSVFDRRSGRSVGFDKCVNLAQGNPVVALTDDEAATLRVIDAMRDDEQHWFNEVSEQVLYLQARAGITVFDTLLQRVFGEHLADHLPTRVLPISADPPQDLDLLIDQEYTLIAQLLKPHRRARHQARARIRTLLAMEAYAEPDSRVSAKDVDRVEKGVKAGQDLAVVFPRLSNISTRVEGFGATIEVHITKKDGAPVRYEADETVPAAAIREVDLSRKYHLSPTELAATVNLSNPRSLALRQHLGIDTNPDVHRTFVMGKQRHPRYSDAAMTMMRQAITVLDMDAVWAGHAPQGRRPKSRICTAPGCATQSPAPAVDAPGPGRDGRPGRSRRAGDVRRGRPQAGAADLNAET